jgi:hypothetical protein
MGSSWDVVRFIHEPAPASEKAGGLMTLTALFFMGLPHVEPARDRHMRAMEREIRPPLLHRIEPGIAPAVG